MCLCGLTSAEKGDPEGFSRIAARSREKGGDEDRKAVFSLKEEEKKELSDRRPQEKKKEGNISPR